MTPDELVEKAARLIDYRLREDEDVEAEARAVVALVLEEAANVADFRGGVAIARGEFEGMREATKTAAAIRALIPSQREGE